MLRLLAACCMGLLAGMAHAQEAGRAVAPEALAPAPSRSVAEPAVAPEAPSAQALLSLYNQLAELKAEVARLRGQQEELLHAQQLAEQRTKALYGDLDARIKALPRPPVAPPVANAATPPAVAAAAAVRAEAAPTAPAAAGAKPVPAKPAPDPEADTKAYEAALNQLKEGNYPAAVKAFKDYLVNFPRAPLVANAYYWLGLSQFSLSEYPAAIATQQRLLKEYPDSAKVPDAMVSLARAHYQTGDADAGRRWLERVVAEHPASKAADTARKLLELHK